MKTIENKLLRAIRDSVESISNIYGIEEASINCEQVVENVAIQFAEWLRHECVISSDEGFYYDDSYMSAKELFEIFKQETGL